MVLGRRAAGRRTAASTSASAVALLLLLAVQAPPPAQAAVTKWSPFSILTRGGGTIEKKSGSDNGDACSHTSE
jgi:hypothetical protein